MISSLNPATLRQGLDLETFLAVTGSAGFQACELRLASAAEVVEQRGLAAMQDLLQRHGLQVASVGYPIGLGAAPEEFEQSLAALPAALDLAARLGAPGGALGLPWRAADATISRTQTIERLGRIAPVAARAGLAIYLEFIALHVPARVPWSQTLGQALDIVEEVGAANVGVLIDSYHWHLSGSQPSDLERVRPGLPILVHINDAPAGAPSTLDDSMRLLPGEGVLNLPQWLRQLKRTTGFDGFVSVELFSEELRALDPAEAARRAKRALDGVLAAADAAGA